MEYDLGKIAYILQTSKIIAIVGLSPKPGRPSYQVASYLKKQGYKIIPVNPGHKEILGEKCYSSLFEIPELVNVVDIFRRSEEVPPIVRAAIQIDAPYLWMQEGIRHEKAANLARAHDMTVIEDLCIKKMHQKCVAENLVH